jgi:hypothetical protein
MKYYLRQIKLDKRGFSKHGEYLGLGAVVWETWPKDEKGRVRRIYMQPTRDAAKAYILKHINPDIEFFP